MPVGFGMAQNDTKDSDRYHAEDAIGGPVTVRWEDGMGNRTNITINPYRGSVLVDGREFDVSVLLSDDVDPRMYRQLSTEVEE